MQRKRKREESVQELLSEERHELMKKILFKEVEVLRGRHKSHLVPRQHSLLGLCHLPRSSHLLLFLLLLPFLRARTLTRGELGAVETA